MLRRNFVSLVPKLAATVAAPSFMRLAHAEEGVSAKDITIGSSLSLTGPLAAFSKDVKTGIEAAFAQVNAKGGVQGRQLQLQALDDGYVPARTLDNVRKLVGGGGTLALLSCVGTPNNAGILPYIEEAGIPYVAPLSGASSLRKASSRNVFHVRASYTDEAQRLIQRLTGMGMNNLVVVYLDNGYGREVLADVVKFMDAAGTKPSAQIALDTNGKNMAEVLSQVQAARPGGVFLATAGAASTPLVAGLRKQSPSLPMVGLSVTLTQDGIKELGGASGGVALGMVMPDPYRAKTALVREYQAAMRAIGQQEFAMLSLEGYVNARVLAEGLERAGKDVTRNKLRNVMASMRGLNLDGFMIDYSAPPYVGSKFVDLGVLGSNGRFMG
jgi:ABC-type branched-subunit amino acid transport system substrate-binding protein